MVHFDPTAVTRLSNAAQQVITFDKPIVGVFPLNNALNNSDATFAPAGLTYGYTNNNRDFELGNGNNRDRFSISADRMTLTILNVRAGNNNMDQLRVLIAPEPSTWALFGLGAVGLGVVVRHRRRRRRAEKVFP